MAQVSYPTVLVGLGKLGQDVVAEVRQSLPDAPLMRDTSGEPQDIALKLEPLLEDLLRAGKGASDRQERRLDLLMFAAALQGGPDDLWRACDSCARLLSSRYGAIFPPDRPPEQRNAALHLVVVVPALSSGRAAEALNRIAKVEAWAKSSPAYPLLARVWLVAQQTAAGTLSVDEMLATAASFAVAAVGSGLRTEDAVSQRLAHPTQDEGLVGFLSVASLDLPEAQLRRYAGLRASYDALSTLVDRVEKPVSDPAVALGAVSPLKHEEWLTSFQEGDAAQRCRRLAATLSGASFRLPAEIKVGAFEPPESVRENYDILFKPGTQVKQLTGVDNTEIDEMLVALDRAESDAAAAVQHGVDALFSNALTPATGLARVPEVEVGLRRVLAKLGDEQAADLALQEAAASGRLPPTDADPLRKELEEATASLPSRKLVFAIAGAVGLGLCLLVHAITLYAQTDPVAGSPTAVLGATPVAPTGFDWRSALPWFLGLLLGGAGGYGWAWLTSHLARRDLRAVLKSRRDALESLWARGGGGAPGKQAEAQLVLRRLRVRRGAMAALEDALLRLKTVRATLLSQRDRLRQDLVDMGIVPTVDASQDDLSSLIQERGPLHRALLPPKIVARWVARCRTWSEPAVWADRFLEGNWPARGITEDVPCADAACMAALADRQIEPLRERSIFEDEEAASAAATAVESFASRSGSVLAWAVQPKNALGDPAVGVRAGDGFSVAPGSGRDALAVAFRDLAWRVAPLWSSSPAARVLFVRSWEGYRLEEVARGAGVLAPPAEPQRGVS